MTAADSGARTELGLSEAQSGLWYAQKLDPANPVFNTGHYLDLRGPLDRAAFEAAANRMTAEAQALSLRFTERDGDVRQTVDPALQPILQIVDLSADADAEANALASMRRAMDTPVDLAAGPLAAQTLYILALDRHLWALRVHHLATDGYGMMLLTQRLADLYNGGAGEAFPPLATLATDENAYRDGPKRDADAAFWRAALDALPDVTGLAPIPPGGRAVTAHRVHRSEIALPADLSARLLARAEAAGVTWPDLVTTLAAAYCRRYAGVAETVVGAPHMGRMGSALARLPAMVMNILPLRVAFAEDAPLDDVLVALSKSLIQARRHGRYRSEQMRRDLGLIGGARRLYGALINILPFDRPPRFNGLEAGAHVLGTGPVDDIHFNIRGDARTGLTLQVEANPDLYSEAEAAAHGVRLAAFLDTASTTQRLLDVPVATPAEAARELEKFNATEHPVPDVSLTALLEAAMRRTPDAPALIFGDTTLSYAELDRRTAALAAALRARGAGADRLVAICLHRSLELVIALIATLRAGGAYLPLDPDHPPQRLAALLNAAEPVVVLSDGDPHAVFGALLLNTCDWPDAPADFAPPSIGLNDASYVIYTSGSTGDPKGVLVEHRAIVNRLLWMQAHYDIGAHTVILQKTPATFDVSVWEFFLALISGGALVVAPPGAHRDPAALAALIRRHAVTDLHFVPSMLTAFLAEPAHRGLAVRHVFCSGEELPADLRDNFHRTMRAELHNLYGPTEAAVDVSYWPAGPDDRSRPIPIGWPIWNTRLVILDDRLRPVAPGMTGELYLGGVQLARGYLARPDLTADRFIPDPHHPGQRLYKTGDLARRRHDGAVIFLGRADHQVKIRGLRIELGEIESAIAASGQAREHAVIAREDRPGDRRLVAYLVPTPGYDPAALRAFLAARLPDYMVPSAFVTLDAMPLTSSGKLDRKALPAPSLDLDVTAPTAPMSGAEAALAEIYRDILGLPAAPGPDGDFFTLGGDSLQAVHLMLRVRERFGRDPGIGALFDRPRVAELAALVEAERLDFDNGLGPLIRLVEGDPRLPPLFVVHPAGGLAWGYRTLARAFSPRRTVYGLQSPALDLAAPIPESIDALAADYADRVLALGAPGPIHLLGWSVGGIIAQAMAARLEALGHSVGLMAMLDSYPAECWRAEPEPDEIAALRALLSIAGYDPSEHMELDTRQKIVDFLRAGDNPLGGLPDATLDGVIRVVLDTNRLVRQHYHSPYGGVTTHVRAALDHQGRPLTPQLWEKYSARLDVIDAPFLHPQLTGAAAAGIIAPPLDARMHAAERSV